MKPLPDTSRQSQVERDDALMLALSAAQISPFSRTLAADDIIWSEELQVLGGLTPHAFEDGFAAIITRVHEDDREHLRAALKAGVKTGGYRCEFRVSDDNGAIRWIDSCARFEFAATGRPLRLVGVDIDITARKQTEQALHAELAEQGELLRKALRTIGDDTKQHAELSKALTQSQRFEVLGQLSGGIAHDFNNVLAAVDGALQVLQKKVNDPLALDFVKRGQRGVDRATRLVRQLMGFARTQSIEPRVFDVGQLLRDAKDFLQLAVGDRVSICIDARCTGHVLVDAGQFEVALLNLVINARDAMPDGGEVVIRATDLPVPGAAGPVIAGDAMAASVARVQIEVRDTGAGMPPEVLARACEPMFSTKTSGQGTGLGLAMVRQFVQEANGQLALASEPGEGTVVTIGLYCASDNPDSASGVPTDSIDRSRHGGASVLVVDDDPLVRPVTVHYLEELGYRVVQADGGLQALALCEAGEAFEMVITDQVMPGLDGVALAAQLRAARPGLPVLIVTGMADRVRTAGEDVLQKPFTAPELAARVLTLLGRKAQQRGSSMASRIQHPALRELYQAWNELYAGDTLPPADSLELTGPGRCDQSFIADVTGSEPFAFRFAHVGEALTQQLGHSLSGTDSAEPGPDGFALGGLEAAYQRAATRREPTYERMRIRSQGEPPMSFERLILPCGDGETGSAPTRQLAGMVVFENLPQD